MLLLIQRTQDGTHRKSPPPQSAKYMAEAVGGSFRDR